jgi:hypothetical protein
MTTWYNLVLELRKHEILFFCFSYQLLLFYLNIFSQKFLYSLEEKEKRNEKE